MTLRIISADQRLAEACGKTTIAVFGPSGSGKTWQLKTLPSKETLCVDLEAGMKSVQDWPGDSIPVRTFADAIDIACLIGGVNPAADEKTVFCESHYRRLAQTYSDLVQMIHRPHAPTSDTRMLDCEFTVTEGPHAKRKFWQMFTVQGGKVDENGVSIAWKISRSAFRAMIDSALGLDPADMSEAAKQKRILRGLADLNGITFVAKIKIEPSEDPAWTACSTTCASRSLSCCSTGRSRDRSPPAWVVSGTASHPLPSSARSPT